MNRTLVMVLVLSGVGCGADAGFDEPDALFLPGPDLLPLCVGNNDGKIDRSELQLVTGISVNYLFNPPGTSAVVSTDGTPGPDGPEWDLRSTQGQVHGLTLDRVRDQWFRSAFPDADYATVADVGSGLIGLFKLTPTALELLGYASAQPDQTLLVYDTPIVSVHFPIQLGDSWISVGHINNGKLMGQPVAATDTYEISVDQRGSATLPYLRFGNVLRVRVKFSELLPGGIAQSRIQYMFYHECYGELGRMVSSSNELNDSFTAAAEFRRLAL